MKRFALVLIACSALACSSSSSGDTTDPTGGDAGGNGGNGGDAGGAGGGGGMTDADYQAAAVANMHTALLADIYNMQVAAKALQDAAPDAGWDPTTNAAAVTAMKAHWIDARAAYEHIEGALAPLFPSLDVSIDARYDDFLTTLESTGGDDDLFDGTGVTGMHAIERILYSDVTPQRVIDFEDVLPGYVASGYPTTTAKAKEFKTSLLQKFITDADSLNTQWTPAKIDVAIAFQGLISLMNEQREKVQKASSNEEESRYSQRTMVDLRDNLLGSRNIYTLFQPWILSKKSSNAAKDGGAIDAAILKGFGELDTAYGKVSGDAIPEVPDTWSAEDPSAEDLATPFGQLYSSVLFAVDPTRDGSVVSEMNAAAAALGFPEFQQGG